MANVFQKSDGNCRAELCETVDKLSDILNTDNFQKLMKKFGKNVDANSSAELFDTLAPERTLSAIMPAAVMQLNAATQLGSRFRYVLIKTLCLILSHVGWTHQSDS